MTTSRYKAIGGALIVGGTAIGAGMLALPVVTAAAGFLPAALIYLICWLFSAATGLLFLEICLWMPNDANIISMAHHLLGPAGKVCAWLLYLFLFYCLTIAYVIKGGAFFSHITGDYLPQTLGILLFTCLFGWVVYIGASAVDRINTMLMIGLGGAYLAFIIVGSSEIKVDLLKRTNWLPAALGLPVIFTSFSFQGVIPSLTTYLERNPKAVRFAIFAGSALPFITYVIWQFLIIGLVPLSGEHGLQISETAVEPLRFLFPSSPIHWIGQFFAMFALTTSFLGVTLGLLDFLSDGLQMPKTGWRKLFLCTLIYVPAALIAIVNPSIFLTALGYAGGVGCALLLGLLPVIMVWVGRYVKGYSHLQRQLKGGKIALVVLAAFIAFELAIEIAKELGHTS
ncbi:MAG: aromatic amino acid transport family protein [Chlamydiota bacterium]